MKVLIPSKLRLTRATRILVRHPGGYSEYEVRSIMIIIFLRLKRTKEFTREVTTKCI